MKVWALLLTLCALQSKAAAHRLDECLLATRVDVLRSGVELQLILVPGKEVLPHFMKWVDADGNGLLDQEEANQFAQAVLTECQLQVNATLLSLTLTKTSLPNPKKLAQGLGQFRIHAQAKVAHRLGKSELSLHCAYQEEHCVYLVNALLPEDKAIKIGRQRRDRLQKDYQLSFTYVKSDQSKDPA